MLDEIRTLIRAREAARLRSHASLVHTLGPNTTTPHHWQARVRCRLCPSLLAWTWSTPPLKASL
eukprot:4442282-Pleurochrysis_carterae.AAC.1